MYKKTVTYKDFNGVERTESYYFNLNQVELMKMEVGTTGGFVEMVQRVIDAKDAPEILRVFEDLVLKAYGVKSDDGKRFEKSDKLTAEFASSAAYPIIYMEFATNADSAAEFVKGIIPADLSDKLPASAEVTK